MDSTYECQVNSWIVRRNLKRTKLWKDLTAKGMLFHTKGVEYLKVRLPHLVVVEGRGSLFLSLERRDQTGWSRVLVR